MSNMDVSYHLSMIDSDFEDFQLQAVIDLYHISLEHCEEIINSIDKIITVFLFSDKKIRLYAAKILKNLCFSGITYVQKKDIVKAIIMNISAEDVDRKMFKEIANILDNIDPKIVSEVSSEIL